MTQLDPEFIAKLRDVVEGHSSALYHINDVYTSRVYRVGTNLRGLVKNPREFGPKIPKLLLRNPYKIFKYLSGSQQLVDVDEKKEFDKDYQKWIKQNELSKKQLEDQRLQSNKFKKRPLISFITPVFSPPNDVLEELIKSVLAQTYDNWELCLGEFAGNIDNQKLLKKYAKIDGRIKPKFFKENGGIAKNSGKILAYAQGEFIALLDHDDLVTPDALYENVKLLNQSDYDFIYSDKDLINNDGHRFNPMFKAGWSPEMVLTANYPTHLNVIRTEIVRKVGGWDTATDGAQDWDLFLRVFAASSLDRVTHIPKILYHWRTIPSSTAMNMSAKPYALEAQRRAVDKYLGSIGHSQAKAYHDRETRMYINWNRDGVDKLNFVVVARDINQLNEFIKNNIRNAQENYNYVLLHESIDTEKLREHMFSDIRAYKPGELGKSLNMLMNDLSGDTAILREALKIDKNFDKVLAQLTGWLQIEGVFAAGPKLTDAYGLVTGTGRVKGLASTFGSLFYKTAVISGIFGSYDWTRNFIALTEKMFVVRAETYKSVGGCAEDVTDLEVLDGLFLKAHSEGMRCVYDPRYSVIDLSPNILELPPSDSFKKLIDQTCAGDDPYYNKNLSKLNVGALISSGTEATSKDMALDI